MRVTHDGPRSSLIGANGATPHTLNGAPETPRAPRTPPIPRVLRAIDDLAAGDHLCCIYETEAEHRAVLTPYLRQGLERDEKVVYIVDAHTAETVLSYLRDDGLDPEPFVARGQLAILGRDETCLRGGAFDPEGMIALLRSEAERAIAQGYVALRVTSEMTWALRGLTAPESLVRHEVLLNEFFPGSRCLAICQYDRRRFEPGVLLDVLRTHPYVVLGRDVCASPHFVPPADFYGPDRPAVELDGWMRGLVERRQAEDALRESRALLASIVDGIPDAVYAKDVEGRYVLFNAGAERFVGKPATEVLGRDDTFLFPADEAAVVMDGDRNAMAMTAPTTWEERLTTADGSVTTLLSTKGPLRDADGAVLGLFGIARDITQRKADEDALRVSEARFRTMFAEAPVGVALIDSLTGRVHEVNPMFARIAGRTVAEMATIDWMSITHPDDVQGDLDNMALMNAGRTSGFQMEKRYLRPDGAPVWIHMTIAPMDVEDKAHPRHLCMIEEITERKRAEQTRAQLVAMLDATPGFVGFADAKDTHILYINPQGRKMVGVQAQEDVTRFQIADVHPEWTNKLFRDEIIPTAIRDGVWTGECAFLNRDGREIPVLMALLAHKSPSGEVERFSTVSMDITARKQAEEALRDSEERYQGITRAVTDYLYSVRVADGRAAATTHGPGCEAVTGYREDELADDPFLWFRMVVADDRPTVEEQARRILTDEDAPPIEHRIVHKDGTIRWVRNTLVPLRDEQGALVGYDGLLQDITERKQAEQTLSESEKKFRAIADYTVDWETWFGTDGTVLWVSPSVERITGYSAAEISAMPDFIPIVIAEEDRAVFAATFQEALRGSKGENLEFRCTHKSGTTFWLGVSWQPIFDTDGNSLGVRASGRDITRRKEAEHALARTSEVLERTGEMAKVGGWELDLRTMQLYWSLETCRIHEVDPPVAPTLEEGIDFYAPEARAIMVAAVQAGIDRGTPWDLELPLNTAKGRAIWVRAQGSAVMEDGKAVRLLGAFHDITERRQAEAEIRALNEGLEQRVRERTAKLVAANQELETFSYSVSHDLRAPLRSISGFASILGRRYRDKLDEKGRHYVDTIAAAGEHLGVLMEELLDYSHMSRAVVRAEPVPLEPLVAGLLSTFGEQLAASGGTLEALEPLAVPLGDPALLERILVNLVENALTYRRPDVAPRVTLSATRRPGSATQRRSVILAVADNGIGIAPAYRERIFEVFTRLHNAEEYPGNGISTGIGLSIVRKAARLMGSDVSVESVEGEGSTFRLELPAAETRRARA